MIAALAAIAMAAATGGGQPSAGVAIGAGNVCLTGSAHPGGTYAPGSVYVADGGNAGEMIGLRASPLAEGQRVYRGEQAIGADWVRFSPASVRLAPGQAAAIPVQLTVPAGARPGLYVADVTAFVQPGTQSDAGVTVVNSAAGMTLLLFSVNAPAPSCSIPPPASAPWASSYAPQMPQESEITASWAAEHAPWLYAALRRADPYFGCPETHGAVQPCNLPPVRRGSTIPQRGQQLAADPAAGTTGPAKSSGHTLIGVAAVGASLAGTAWRASRHRKPRRR